MIALDAADLVVIAGRTIGIGTDAALDQMDIAAAQDAPAEARPSGMDVRLVLLYQHQPHIHAARPLPT